MTETICPECNGEGVVDQDTEDERGCPTCNGSGVVPDDGQGSEEVWNTHPRAGGLNQSKSARREPDLLSAWR
jgi:DnaJ-class molecular chaperone